MTELERFIRNLITTALVIVGFVLVSRAVGWQGAIGVVLIVGGYNISIQGGLRRFEQATNAKIGGAVVYETRKQIEKLRDELKADA